MGFLDSLKKAKSSGTNTAWKVLTTEEQLNQLIADSHQKPVVIFKHSVSCGTSAMAKHGLEREWNFTDKDLDFYYLDLLAYRPISNKIAEVLSVTHQSPQVILISKGKAVYTTSHQAVSISGIRSGLQRLD